MLSLHCVTCELHVNDIKWCRQCSSPMKQLNTRSGKFSAPARECCDNGDWMLQKADVIKGFLAQQRGRTQQANSKTAWLLAWEQLAAEGEAASKQVQQVLQQPGINSCAELQQDMDALSALTQELAGDTQEQQLQLLGQAQELRSLVRRAMHMAGPTAADLLPSEAAALASLQQELQWLQQDVQQQNQGLAAEAQGLIAELTAAAPGSCGHCAGMLDVLHGRRVSQDPDPAAAARALASTAAAEPMAPSSAAAAAVVAAAASSSGEQVQVSNCLPTGAIAAGPAGTGAAAADSELVDRVDAAGTSGAAVEAAAMVTQSAQGDKAAAAAAACSLVSCAWTSMSKCDNATLTEPVLTQSSSGCCSSSRGVSSSRCSQESRGQCHSESSSTELAPGSNDTATGSSTGSSSTVPSTCCSAACSPSDSYKCRSTTSLPHLMEAQVIPQDKKVTAALYQGDPPTRNAQCADFELQQLLWQHPFAPSSLRHELLQAYSTLLQQHQQQLQESSAQQHMHAAECCNWTGDQHALFVWLRSQALQDASAAVPTVKTTTRAGSCAGAGGRPAGSLRSHASTGRGSSSGSSTTSSSGAVAGARSSGCSRASVLQYVGLRMPGKSRQELDRHEDWYLTALQLQRRAEDLQDSWQRQRAAFLTAAGSTLATASSTASAAAEAAAARLSTAVQRQLLHDQMHGMQLLRQEQQELAAAEQAAESALLAAQAAAAAAASQQRSAEQKVLVLQYKQQVAEQQRAAEVQAVELRAAAADAAEAAILASKPAVAARQVDALQRLQQQQEQERRRVGEAAARQQRLADIAAALAPQVDRDPERVLQATAASAAATAAASRSLGQAFRPVHGFTAQQVVADPRFRLIEALRATGALRGGVGGVGYIKQAMARLQNA